MINTYNNFIDDYMFDYPNCYNIDYDITKLYLTRIQQNCAFGCEEEIPLIS